MYKQSPQELVIPTSKLLVLRTRCIPSVIGVLCECLRAVTDGRPCFHHKDTVTSSPRTGNLEPRVHTTPSFIASYANSSSPTSNTCSVFINRVCTCYCPNPLHRKFIPSHNIKWGLTLFWSRCLTYPKDFLPRYRRGDDVITLIVVRAEGNCASAGLSKFVII